MDELKGDALCHAYREELRRVYGDEWADKSHVSHHRGWYYITVARRFSDGSVGVGDWQPFAYRRKDVLERLGGLRKIGPKEEV